MKMFSQKLVCKITTLIAGLVFGVLLSPSIFALTLDRIVAKVNADVITLMTLEDRVAIFLNQMKAAGSDDKKLVKNKLMMKVLDGMIAEKLQIQEAKKLGMVVTRMTSKNHWMIFITKIILQVSSLKLFLQMKVVILTITKKLFVIKFLFLGWFKCKSVAPQSLEKDL